MSKTETLPEAPPEHLLELASRNDLRGRYDRLGNCGEPRSHIERSIYMPSPKGNRQEFFYRASPPVDEMEMRHRRIRQLEMDGEEITDKIAKAAEALDRLALSHK